MKRLSLWIMIIAFTFLISGCSFFQKSVKTIAKNDAENAATSRLAAKQIASTWPLNSGFLKPALAGMKELLPCDCAADIQALDAIAAKCQIKDAKGIATCEELIDEEMGQTLWLWGKTWGTITKSGVDTILQKFFPKVFQKIAPYTALLGL